MQFSSDGVADNWVLFTEFKIVVDDNNNVVQEKFRSPLLEDTENNTCFHFNRIVPKRIVFLCFLSTRVELMFRHKRKYYGMLRYD